MSLKYWAVLAALPLTACNINEADEAGAEPAASVERDWQAELGYDPYAEDNYADAMASDDASAMAGARNPASVQDESEGIGSGPAAATSGAIADPEQRPVMQVQVVLDRQGFGPGVIDGRMGVSTRNALKGFQEANGLDVTGELDDATKASLEQWERIGATRVVTIPQAWASLQFPAIPDDPAEQAAMEMMGYESLDEKLAERFHTTVAVLRELNPGGRPAGVPETPSAATAPSPSASAPVATTGEGQEAAFRAGQQIRVPNIGADRIAPDAIQDRGWRQTLASLGVGTEQPEVARLVVDESEGWLKGYDAQDNLVALFTVTTGSTNDPLPVGDWGINGVAHNPSFSYQPTLFWDVADDEDEQMLPPGPNGPVGVVWIDLTKEHYGIHGTSAPETIGRAQSHGCVRLTNWDAARLATMVSTGTEVLFQT